MKNTNNSTPISRGHLPSLSSHSSRQVLQGDDNMKHTKGKWNLFLQDDNGFGITNGDSVIAIAGEDDLLENEANAILISQAPAMLDYLKKLREADLPLGLGEVSNFALDELIAKAEGGE